MLPLEIAVYFDDGSTVIENWDGKSRTKDFTYTGKRKATRVKIDPEYKIVMDVNYINNSMSLKPDRVPVKRITGKLALMIQFILNIITF
ncbi:MAG: hypothetical protein U0X39_09215 [Bacteroidales bacterium]